MDRSPVWIGLCDMALAVLAVVVVAVNPPKPASGVEMKAEILATIEWSNLVDADVDIHMMTPSHKPVFYGARDVGCSNLDRDDRGFLDSVITLDDGSQVRKENAKETISIRCIEPGHYDLAANLYAYRADGLNQTAAKDLGLKVHVEIVGLNPHVHVVYSGDIVLDRVAQTVNWASFDMDRQGHVTLDDPPLTPVTVAYQKRLGEP